MLMTLKRFEFDFDTMQRVKVNDYFEWPMDLDMSPYTQEYLAKKEAYEKAKKDILERGGADAEDKIEALEQEKLKHPKDYYEYDIVLVLWCLGSDVWGLLGLQCLPLGLLLGYQWSTERRGLTMSGLADED